MHGGREIIEQKKVWKLKGRTSTKFEPKLGKGVFTFEHPLAKKVPTPSVLMEHICRKKGFKKTIEHDRRMGNVEVWVKEVDV